MKLNNPDPKIQEKWSQLCELFMGGKGLNIDAIKKLDIDVYTSRHNHPKLYINYNNKKHVITVSTTPSDRYWGRQVLRQIRRVYEEKV